MPFCFSFCVFVHFLLVVVSLFYSTTVTDCLERLISKMICYVLSGTINFVQSLLKSEVISHQRKPLIRRLFVRVRCLSSVWIDLQKISKCCALCVAANIVSWIVYYCLCIYCLALLMLIVQHTSLFPLQPNVNVKTNIQFRLLVFSSLCLSLNTDLNRDEDQQDERLKVPSTLTSSTSPQPVSRRLCV